MPRRRNAPGKPSLSSLEPLLPFNAVVSESILLMDFLDLDDGNGGRDSEHELTARNVFGIYEFGSGC